MEACAGRGQRRGAERPSPAPGLAAAAPGDPCTPPTSSVRWGNPRSCLVGSPECEILCVSARDRAAHRAPSGSAATCRQFQRAAGLRGHTGDRTMLPAHSRGGGEEVTELLFDPCCHVLTYRPPPPSLPHS